MRLLGAGEDRAQAVGGGLEAHPQRLLALRALRDGLREARRLTRCNGSRPWRARRAGRAKSKKVTIAETGLPGSPRTSTPSRAPNHVGLPGASATRQKRCSTPSRASAGLTWSCGPTETPPETRPGRLPEGVVERRGGGGGAVGPVWRATASPPARATSPPRVSALES